MSLPVVACKNCAYCFDEPGNATDICVHRGQRLADVKPDYACHLFSRVYDASNDIQEDTE